MKLKHFSLSYGEQVFRALSDQSRIRILHLILRNKEMCITDLEQVLGFTQTKTSRHLGYLRNTGLVSSRKLDQWVYYSLKEESADLMTQLFKYMERDALLLQDAETYRILFSNRELAANKLQLPRWPAP